MQLCEMKIVFRIGIHKIVAYVYSKSVLLSIQACNYYFMYTVLSNPNLLFTVYLDGFIYWHSKRDSDTTNVFIFDTLLKFCVSP